MSLMMPSTAAHTEVIGGFQPSMQRTYTANPVAVTTVTPADDVVQLQNRGWILLPGNGTTAQRPAPNTIAAGAFFVDTSIGKTIWWEGAAWRSVLDASVV
jgi:hypothetical protein